MHASHMLLCCRIKEIEDEMARTQKNKVQALNDTMLQHICLLN